MWKVQRWRGGARGSGVKWRATSLPLELQRARGLRGLRARANRSQHRRFDVGAGISPSQLPHGLAQPTNRILPCPAKLRDTLKPILF